MNLPNVLTLALMSVYSSVCSAILTETTKGTCNPKSDMVFVLNGNTSISIENFQKQKDFVRDVITGHNSPPGAVHVGILVCSDGNISSSEFLSSKHDILTLLKSIEKPKSNTVKNTKRHCLDILRMTFSVRHRQNTARTALFLIGEEGKWSKDDAKLMKEETEAERVSLLMVGVGIQSFSVLNAIQGIVSERRRFYVLSSYDSLKWLSTELTRGPCLPLSLEMTEPVTPGPTTVSSLIRLSLNRKCRALGNGQEYLKEILFLGWQRRACPPGTRINTRGCRCVVAVEPTTEIPETSSISSKTPTKSADSPPTKAIPISTERISTKGNTLITTAIAQ